MKLAILDRDGVINHDSDEYIKTPDEWIPIEGSLEAIATLGRAGFVVVVATNQSGIARGLFDTPTLHRIHAKMTQSLAAVNGKLDAIFYCPHSEREVCACRKPKDGLFLQALQRFNALPENTLAVGDALRDIQAARSAGIIKPALVLTGKGIKTKSNPDLPADTPIFDNLAQTVDFWLSSMKSRKH